MTPRQARVALGGFFLLAIGVTSNALYLQGAVSGTAEKTAAAAIRPKPRPPGPPKSAKTAKPPVKTATADAPQAPPQGVSKGAPKSPPSVKVRTVRVAAVSETRPENTDTDTVRAVQEQLNRQGYGPIGADGVMRQPTRAAIMAFEHDHRLGLTGEASQDLLKKLVFGTPEGAAGDVEVRSPHAEAIVKQVQQSLIARGYRAGAVDGQVGAEIVAAIRTFETDQGLVPKGRISADVLERLQTGISAGGKHPKSEAVGQ
ncbi:MAG: peptidoglycan-binding domain-containing protein [Hyphomicrobiaceae bacterium]